jgi:hypothetical protein
VPGNDTYQILIDPGASPDSAPPRFQVPAGACLEDVANALDLIFGADSQCDAVLLVAAGHAAGVVTRARFQTLISPSGPHRGDRPVGAGDGASLAGPPVSYEVFTYRCRRCGTVVYRIEADVPAPDCEEPGHGSMDREA